MHGPNMVIYLHNVFSTRIFQLLGIKFEIDNFSIVRNSRLSSFIYIGPKKKFSPKKIFTHKCLHGDSDVGDIVMLVTK